MNLHQFRFVQEAVRRNLNLTETARVLHTSQPGVSKAIIELEEELGVEIFARHGKRLKRVTEPGQHKNTVLTAEARGKAEAEAQKKMEDIQRKQGEVQNFRTNTQRSLQQRIKTHRDLLLEEITKIVNNLAKLRGATLVVDKSGPTLFGIPSVLYADPSYDMTEEVVQEVNKDRPAPAAKPTVTAPAAPVSEKK